jgi:hypothetical protein
MTFQFFIKKVREYLETTLYKSVTQRVKDFKKIAKTYKYKFIGNGSERITFALNDKEVVKFIIDKNFFEQNKKEIFLSKKIKKNVSFFTKIIDYDKKKFMWIKAEKVITFQREDPNFDNLLIKNLGITKEKYPKIFEILNFYSEDGPIIFFRDMLKYSCQYSTSENVDFQKCKKEINKIKTENQWYADLIYYIKKYDISISDIRDENCGYRIKNNKKQLVILDYGLSFF